MSCPRAKKERSVAKDKRQGKVDVKEPGVQAKRKSNRKKEWSLTYTLDTTWLFDENLWIKKHYYDATGLRAALVKLRNSDAKTPGGNLKLLGYVVKHKDEVVYDSKDGDEENKWPF